MRFTSGLKIFRSRTAQAIALGGVISTVGCKDVTAPPDLKAPTTLALGVQLADADELTNLSASLDDMTGWSLASIKDDEKSANIVGILNSLKAHLKSGKVDASQQDVSDARAFIGSLSEQKKVEIGAVSVTLDVIQSALDKASQ